MARYLEVLGSNPGWAGVGIVVAMRNAALPQTVQYPVCAVLHIMGICTIKTPPDRLIRVV